MKHSLAAVFFLLAFVVTPARAQSDAIHMIDAVFQMFDENKDGYISTPEANHFIDKTFAQMDPKKTGRVTPEAWLRFSFGLADIAADWDRSEAYNRAKMRIFLRWDRNHSGFLTLEDYRAGVLGEAREGVGDKAKEGEPLMIDLAAFKRAPFVRQLLNSLH
jgi:hypothetical protein